MSNKRNRVSSKQRIKNARKDRESMAEKVKGQVLAGRKLTKEQLMFELCGTFDRQKGMKAINDAAITLLLTFNAMGGVVPDDPETYGTYAEAAGIKILGYAHILTIMEGQLGWIIRTGDVAQRLIQVTPKGRERALELMEQLGTNEHGERVQ